MGRNASGVMGMRLVGDDEVIAMRVPQEGEDVLVITDGGYGKRTPIADYRETGRGAKGVRTIAAKAEAERGSLIAAHCVTGEEDLIVSTASGIVTRMSVGEVRSMGRSTSGVRIQRIKGEEDRVSSCAIVPADDEVEESTEGVVEGDATAAPVAEAVGEEAAGLEAVAADDAADAEAEDELVIEDEDASSDDE
jgi:DNA gyrase subunit A